MNYLFNYNDKRKYTRNKNRKKSKTPSRKRKTPMMSIPRKKMKTRTPNSAKRKLSFNETPRSSKKSRTSAKKTLTPRLDNLDDQIKKLEQMMKTPNVSPKSLTPRFNKAEKQLTDLDKMVDNYNRRSDQEERFAKLEGDWNRQKRLQKTAKLARKFNTLETAWEKQKAEK